MSNPADNKKVKVAGWLWRGIKERNRDKKQTSIFLLRRAVELGWMRKG